MVVTALWNQGQYNFIFCSIIYRSIIVQRVLNSDIFISLCSAGTLLHFCELPCFYIEAIKHQQEKLDGLFSWQKQRRLTHVLLHGTGNSLSGGAVAGIVIACIVILIVSIWLVAIYYRRQQMRKATLLPSPEDPVQFGNEHSYL